ncbi:MAG: hypothetical protein AB1345_09930 [Chloroflexota bacterium]
METFDDFGDFDTFEPRPKRSGLVWNILTGLVMLAILCVGVVFLTLYLNPYGSLNPFPPPTMPATISFPTATPTPRQLPTPLRTSTPTQPQPTQPSPTITLTPTSLLPTNTPLLPTLVSPTITPTVGQTATLTTPVAMPFIIQPGSPVEIPSITFHPDRGCNYLGVAGQAFDLSGGKVLGLVVKITGMLGGNSVELISLTGTTALPPGAYSPPDGYEITLGETPIASENTLYIQLLDAAGLPLSDQIYFKTYNDCQKNLILINFRQVQE